MILYWYLGIPATYSTTNLTPLTQKFNNRPRVHPQLNPDQMVEVLRLLESFGCPVLYIPGNHDCLCQFENKSLTDRSISLHKRQHKLADGLVLIGFGGSLPAFERAGEMVWEGYPFRSE